MKLTIVEKNLLSWTAMHIDFVMCNNHKSLRLEAGEKLGQNKIFIFSSLTSKPQRQKTGRYQIQLLERFFLLMRK